MKRVIRYILVLPLMLLASCSPELPAQYTAVDALPEIFPDYTNVTVPCNIAPLAFRIDVEAKDYVTRLSAGGKEVVAGGNEVAPSQADWQALLAAARGGAINVEVYAAGEGGWERYAPFEIYVSEDEIDRYISYRLIPPSYVAYEKR